MVYGLKTTMQSGATASIRTEAAFTKTLSLKVIGYYGHANAGDEQYKLSFVSVFDRYLPRDTGMDFNIDFVDADKLLLHQFGDTDIIVLGGGDILNDYFLDKVISKFHGCKNKVIAVSVGLPYTPILTDTNKLNIIDYIFIRTQQDIELFSRYFHPHRVLYLPDISYSLMESQKSLSVYYQNKVKLAKSLGKRIVAISLSRHIYHKNYESLYNNIITTISHFVKYLVTFDFYVVFVPFNTNNDNPSENDLLVHKDVIDVLTRNGNFALSNITVIEEQLDAMSLIELYTMMDLCIPMRFHACLFSMYANVPFLPIFTTRKILNLLIDVEWMYGYELKTNERGIPTEMDLTIMMTRFIGLMESAQNNDSLRTKLKHLNKDIFGKHFATNIKQLIDVVTLPYSKTSVQSLTTQYRNEIDDKIETVSKAIQIFAQSKNFEDFRMVDDNCLQNIIVSIVSYHLTHGSVESKYNYGLKSKMFAGIDSYNFKEEWRWILRNEQLQRNPMKLLNNPYGLFNLGFVDQIDYSGSHRSGWQFVYDNIKYMHNNNSDLLLDMYVDRTFHWNADVNNILNIIPYRKNWVGFVHHTFDTSFSDFNCHNLLKSRDFLESLKVCKGLIVLSTYLKAKLCEELQKLGYDNVPVLILTHPTDTSASLFSMTEFLNNEDKKIVHVGGWLRNTYTFYNLILPTNSKLCYGRVMGDSFGNMLTVASLKFRKVALRGKSMNNYYPPNNFIDDIHNILIQGQPQCYSNDDGKNVSQNVSCPNISHNISVDGIHDCNSRIKNNWYKFFYEDLCNKLKSIDFIDYLDNSTYDILLTKNIVFVHLIDASAVNTVIECIVRNTPVIINKHPAVMELLGDDYPLYFNNSTNNYMSINNEVYNLLTDGTRIKKAHVYLKKLDKRRLSVNHFVNEFIQVIETVRKSL